MHAPPAQVSNSSGTGPPRLTAPAKAADCHIHIYDPRFAPPVTRPANSTVADYRLLQKRIGVSRVVIVTPRNYGTDNSVTLDAIENALRLSQMSIVTSAQAGVQTTAVPGFRPAGMTS